MDFLRYFDCFAKNSYIYVMKEKKEKTIIGGILSILIFLSLVLVFFVYLTRDVLSQNPTILYGDEDNSDISFELKFPIFLTFSNEEMIKSSQIEIFIGKIKLNFDEIMTEDCRSFLSEESFITKNFYSCFQIAENISLSNNNLRLSVQNQYESFVNLIFLDYKPDLFSLENHKTSNYHILKSKIKRNQNKSVGLYFKKTEIFYDQQIILSNHEQESIYTLKVQKNIITLRMI